MAKPRLIMIGIDGGTFRVIDPMISAGKLPNIKQLIDKGVRTTLKSTIPPVTAPAWVTMMTGVNPGKHGLFEFRKLEPITYDMSSSIKPRESFELMHSHAYAGKTLWDILSNKGYKVSVLAMPMTYPAWKINGYMLSGFPTPDFKQPQGYPDAWASSIGYLFDLDVLAKGDYRRMISECQLFASRLGDILLQQLEERLCDVYAVVFSSTDFLQHYLWKYYIASEDNNYATAIQDIYIKIDEIIGRVLQRIDRTEYSLMILSDHGFNSTADHYFHTNNWLSKEGYLGTHKKNIFDKTIDLILDPLRYKMINLRLTLKSYMRYLPSFVQKKLNKSYYASNLFDWTRTKAFRYKMEFVDGIVINLAGRQPAGIVQKSDYESLRTEIIEKLEKVQDPKNGLMVIQRAYRREEIYKGSHVEFLPDIIVFFDLHYTAGVSVAGNLCVETIPVEAVLARSGDHDMNGILILSGAKFRENTVIDEANISDILPTVLHVMGESIPKYVDGRVIKDAFKAEYSSSPIDYVESMAYESDMSCKLPLNDEDAMKAALKGLGYLS